MALQTVQVSVEPRLSTALKDRSFVPYSSPKVSARLRYHVSNSVVFLHRAGTLAKEYPLSKLFSKAEPVPFEKKININLVYSSCLKHASEMLLGDSRQLAGWPANAKFHFPIVSHSSITRPCCSIERSYSSAKLLVCMYSSTRQAQNASTRRPTRHQGIHMHDHSRFQRDIDDVTGVSLSLSLSLSTTTTTTTTHKSHSRTI